MTRKNKYNARKVTINGKTCDSLIEGRKYSELLLCEKQGEISSLELHPRYPIIIDDKKICTVVLDFEFYDNVTKSTRFIDVKGVYTSESKLRHKLLSAVNGIDVEIWKK